MITWRKSARSNGEGACVEVGNWRTSSRSNEERMCVEVGTNVLTYIRDSKQGEDGPRLSVSPVAWSAFVTIVKTF